VTAAAAATTAITVEATERVKGPFPLRQRRVDGGTYDIHVWREIHGAIASCLDGSEGSSEVDRSTDWRREMCHDTHSSACRGARDDIQ
jgi:hypothetical protein